MVWKILIPIHAMLEPRVYRHWLKDLDSFTVFTRGRVKWDIDPNSQGYKTLLGIEYWFEDRSLALLFALRWS
jgi:hypothetical protein